MLLLALPLIEHFKIDFDYEYNGWTGAINSKGSMQLEA